MSIALKERGRRRKAETRLNCSDQTKAIASAEPDEHLVLRDFARFVENSDLSIPRIAELLRVSDVILSMWIAGTAKPSTIKLREIESLVVGPSWTPVR
jgi:DNA-binding transcriptional regulator YiaG